MTSAFANLDAAILIADLDVRTSVATAARRRVLRSRLGRLNAREVAIDVAAHRRGMNVKVSVSRYEDLHIPAHVLDVHRAEFRNVHGDFAVHIFNLQLAAGAVRSEEHTSE